MSQSGLSQHDRDNGVLPRSDIEPGPGDLFGAYEGNPDHSVSVETDTTLEGIEIRTIDFPGLGRASDIGTSPRWSRNWAAR